MDTDSASKEELMSVTGIGEIKAGAILEHRKGRCFGSVVGELTHVKGFRAKTVEKMRAEEDFESGIEKCVDWYLERYAEDASLHLKNLETF